MTRFQDFQHCLAVLPWACGFVRPSGPNIARVNGASVADRLLPLDDLWGRRAAESGRLLDGAADSVEIPGYSRKRFARPPSVLRFSAQSVFWSAHTEG